MRILLAAAFLLAVPTVAAADASPSSSPRDVHKMSSDDCARARKLNKTCVLDIEGTDVEGSTPTNSGTRVEVIKFTEAHSLIRIRKDFIPEIIKSAEDI